MEKKTPHCRLAAVKRLIADGRVRTTWTALAGAAALGLDFDDILDVVMALQPAHFYKSMSSHADHRVWQDVYRVSASAGAVYLKLTVVDDVLIVSFKEL